MISLYSFRSYSKLWGYKYQFDRLNCLSGGGESLFFNLLYGGLTKSDLSMFAYSLIEITSSIFVKHTMRARGVVNGEVVALDGTAVKARQRSTQDRFNNNRKRQNPAQISRFQDKESVKHRQNR